MAGPSLVGRTISHYRIVEKLGEGGMGAVWLAEDSRLRRKVALKFLPAEAASDPSRRQRFELEARAAAVLSHPGIATVYELAESDGQMYIAFERVQGATLRTAVAPPGLPQEQLINIATDVAEALAAAHEAGVVHRDLKPENVMRTSQGSCKVLDFGLARLTPTTGFEDTTRSFLTTTGAVVGTVGYMAPEQLEGKEADFRCDVFSFGTMLYELATGIHPFARESAASTIAAVLTAEPVPLTQRNQLQSPELDRIVRKCLRKRRDERYQSTRDLVVDLRNLRRESHSVEETSLRTPPRDHELFALTNAHRKWWWIHQLYAMFVITPILVYLLWKARSAMPGHWQLALSIAATLILALHWNVRFALVSTAIFNRADLAARMRRSSRWIQWTGWPVVPLLLVTTILAAPKTETLAIMLAVMTTGAVICLVFLDPAVERAAFPSVEMQVSARSRVVSARSWWWLHAMGTLAIGVPGSMYLAWFAGATVNRTWANAVMTGVFVTMILMALIRLMLIFFLIFVPAEAARQARRLTPWERASAIAAFVGVIALASALFETRPGMAAFMVVWCVACLAATQLVAPAIDEVVFRAW